MNEIKVTDNFFKLGKLECFKRTFEYKNSTYKEYIYAVVEEHLDFINDKLTHVRLRQILNLEDYLNGIETPTVIRDFRVSELDVVVFFKK